MSNPSRRTILAAAGTSAAAAAALATAPGALAAPTSSSTEAADPQPRPLVAYIDDVDARHLTILFDEDEVVVHDADLVRRLTRAARR